MKKHINKEMGDNVNSKETIDTFVRQCQDLITEETMDRSFDYVYITKKNSERLSTLINCISKRDDRRVTAHAMTNMFVSFLTVDTKEILREIVKVNEELRLTWGEISKISKSKVDLENTHARISLRRTVGDALTILSKYVSEIKPINGIKFDDFVLNTPFVKALSQTMLDEVEDCVHGICLNFARGYAKHSPNECYIVDTETYDWFSLYEDDYLTNQHVDELIKSAVKYDLNEGPTDEEFPWEFSVVEIIEDDEMGYEPDPILTEEELLNLFGIIPPSLLNNNVDDEYGNDAFQYDSLQYDNDNIHFDDFHYDYDENYTDYEDYKEYDNQHKHDYESYYKSNY